MTVKLVLINRDIETIATNLLTDDFTDDILYEGDSMSELTDRGCAIEPNDLTVISYTNNFLTAYGYKTWVKKFAR